MPRFAVNRRTLLLLAAIVAVLMLGIPQFKRLANDRSILPAYDYVQYWSAGRQLLDGRNPYDADELIVIQRAMFAGHRKTVMMWNPPWTLPLTLPFASLPWRPAQFLWIGLQLAAVLLSADLLWRVLGGELRFRWISWLVALSFTPTLFLLVLGQISGLLLLGVAGFLFYLQRDRPIAAGCCASLCAIKPHLLALFGLTLLLEATHQRAVRRAIVAGTGVLAICSALPLIWNPHVWEQYFEATQKPPSETLETMRQFEHPTPGYLLRELIPGEPFEAQFIPLGLAVLATAGYWLSHRSSWQWERIMPPLVLAAILTAAYGAWAFDLVLLLVPVVQMAVWLSYSGNKAFIACAIAVYLILNGIVLTTITMVGSQSNRLIAPAVLLTYLAVASIGTEVRTHAVRN